MVDERIFSGGKGKELAFLYNSYQEEFRSTMLACDIRIFRLIEGEDGMACLHDNDDNTWPDNFIISLFSFFFFLIHDKLDVS